MMSVRKRISGGFSMAVVHAIPVAALAALLLFSAAGCGERTDERRALTGAGEMDDLEWGEDDTPRRASAGNASGTSRARADRASDVRWTILLRTFRPDDPAEAPITFIQSCASVEPRLGEAQVLRRGPNPIVVFGDYPSAEDARARRDLDWVKGVEFRGQRLLPRAILTRINLRHVRGEFLPNELLSVRQRPEFARIRSLYTLQVEVWGDFDSGTMTLDQVHRRAEERVRQLRREGYQAYFHHDDDQKLSTVCIDLFDAGAWDAQSGIVIDPGLELLMAAFPVHLINGEPVEELIDPRNPRRGGVPQRPTLVEVPRW